MPTFNSPEEIIRFGDAFRSSLVHIVECCQADFLQFAETHEMRIKGLALIEELGKALQKRERLTWLWDYVNELAARERGKLPWFQALVGSAIKTLLNSLQHCLADYPVIDLIKADNYGIDYSYSFLKKERDGNTQEYNAVYDKLVVLDADHRELKSHYQRLSEQHAALQADATQSEAYSALRQQFEQLTKKLNEVQTNNATLTRNNGQLEQALMRATTDVETLTEEMLTFSVENNQLKAELLQSQERYDALKAEFDSYKESNDEKHAQTQSQVRQQAQSMQELQRTVAALVSKSTETPRALDTLSEIPLSQRSASSIQSLLYHRPRTPRSEEPKPQSSYRHLAFHGKG